MNARRMTQDDLELITRATVTGVMRVVPRLLAQLIDERMQSDAVKPLDELRTGLDATNTMTAAGFATLRTSLETMLAKVESGEATLATLNDTQARLNDTHAALFQRASDIDAHIDARVNKSAEGLNDWTGRRLDEYCNEVTKGLTKATAELVDARAVELRALIDENRAAGVAVAQRANEIDERVRGAIETTRARVNEVADSFAVEIEAAMSGCTSIVDARAAELAAQIVEVREAAAHHAGGLSATVRAALAEQIDATGARLNEIAEALTLDIDGVKASVLDEATNRIDALRKQLDACRVVDAARADELAGRIGEAAERIDATGARLDSFAASAIDAVTRTVTEVLDVRIGHERAELQALIAAVPAGPIGEPGTPGKDGEPGRDGYDATFTQPVPYVAGRMFARGAVVQHAGALWYAQTDTDREPGAAMSGFTLIVDGVHPDAIEADERGYLHMRLNYASGRVERLPLNFRPMQYRGIWDEAREYLPNDCLTCNGGLFMAKRENTGQRPDTDAGAAYWQLIVKRGKDGRNGVDGKPGADGRGFVFRGKFAAKTDYRPDDVVLSGDTLLICVKVAPARDRPRAYAPQTSDDWHVLMPAVIVDKR